MKELTENNLDEFKEYYHFLHDSFIIDIHYNIIKDQIELLIDVYWAGNNLKKDATSYVLNKQQLKMYFNQIKEYRCKDLTLSDYIDKICLKVILIDDKKYILFANSSEKPSIYIICDSIQYETILHH